MDTESSKSSITRSQSAESLLHSHRVNVKDRSTKSTMPSKIGYSSLSIVRTLLRIIFLAIMKCWTLCTTGLLILMLTFWFYGGIISLVLILLAVIGFLYNFQDRLLYHPEEPCHARLYVESPSGVPHENVFVKTRDGVHINLLFVKQPPQLIGNAPTVIYLHGNAGNVGHRLFNAYALYTYSGANILLVEYRGYGRSGGSPSEKGLYLDAQAAMDFLLQRTDINHNKFIVFGRSLGGAVAIHLASIQYYAHRISSLIVENTFTSLPEIGKSLFDFKVISWLPKWCFKNKYPSSQLISKIHIPTLFISGMADNLIPPTMMQHLFDVSGSQLKRLARFETGTHNETWQCHGYHESINRFLAEVLQAKELNPPDPSAAYTVDVPFDDRGVFNL